MSVTSNLCCDETEPRSIHSLDTQDDPNPQIPLEHNNVTQRDLLRCTSRNRHSGWRSSSILRLLAWSEGSRPWRGHGLALPPQQPSITLVTHCQALKYTCLKIHAQTHIYKIHCKYLHSEGFICYCLKCEVQKQKTDLWLPMGKWGGIN